MVEQLRQLGDVLAHPRPVGARDLREAPDHRHEQHREHARGGHVHDLGAHPLAGGAAREQQVAEQAARQRLEHLLAPALGLLHTRALLGVSREQRRIGPDLVEEARDAARALELAPVELERRNGEALEAREANQQRVQPRHQPHQPVRDALVGDHGGARGRRVRDRHDVEPSGH